MEFTEVLRRRRMVRAFTPDPVAVDSLAELLAAARRGPSAGRTDAVEFLVLTGPDTATYWDTTLPPPRRATFAWPGLLDAPCLIVVVTRPDAYAERYAEPDKARTGLGEGPEAWPVPYWWVDAGAALMGLLLACVDRGLGACLFGVFEHESAVKATFGMPDDRRLVGTVAVGHPAPDRPGRSAGRSTRPLAEVVHVGRWGETDAGWGGDHAP